MIPIATDREAAARPSLRFGIRTLLLLVGVCGAILLPASLRFRARVLERSAVEQLEAQRVMVGYHAKDASGKPSHWRSHFAPCVRSVFCPHGAAPKVLPESLHLLRRFTAAEYFHLQGVRVNDEHVSEWSNLRKLISLDLNFSHVTNRALPTLAALPKLEVLGLTHTRIDDQGAAILSTSRSLKKLYLEGTKLSDTGLLLLARLPAFEELSVTVGQGVSEQGIERLRRARPELDVRVNPPNPFPAAWAVPP
ncbi:MAG: hypothetical protein U0836_16065 [Pirellulales bacterium]